MSKFQTPEDKAEERVVIALNKLLWDKPETVRRELWDSLREYIDLRIDDVKDQLTRNGIF